MAESYTWTSEQMLEKAPQWSLAGDVAVLNRLKQFSKTLISNAESLNSKVDNLLCDLENASLRLEHTKNEFQSLRHTQFIENRVYEDDETMDVEPEEPKTPEIDEEKDLKDFISKGLKVMREYYERVEVAVSDSEDETNEKSYVLQPKDLYADRPLPYLVGSEEWDKYWHVGLLSESSESEAELDLESSDSELSQPESHENIETRDFQESETSSGHRAEEEEQSGSEPVQVPLSSENFAEQLAAKLGDVISGAKPKVEREDYGGIFADQPPPLDQITPQTSHKDLFSEQIDDGLFWNPDPNQSTALPSEKPVLFDDDNLSSDDEDLISATKKTQKVLKSPYLPQTSATVVPFIDERPPEIPKTPKKKPTGGVSILGPNVDIFGDKGPLKPPKKEDEGLFGPLQDESQSEKKKTISLFDDHDDDELLREEEDIFAFKPSKSGGLFEDLGAEKGLFGDLEDSDVKASDVKKTDNKWLKEAEEDIFTFQLPKKGGFLEDFDPKRGLFDDLGETDIKPSHSRIKESDGKLLKQAEKTTLSLFSDDNFDDLFSIKSEEKADKIDDVKVEKRVEDVKMPMEVENDDLRPEIVEKQAEEGAVSEQTVDTGPPPINLYDPTPPPLLDWEATSDNSGADSDPFSIDDFNSDQSQAPVGLFDEAPPILNPPLSRDMVKTDQDDIDFVFAPSKQKNPHKFEASVEADGAGTCSIEEPALVKDSDNKGAEEAQVPEETTISVPKSTTEPKKLKHNLNINISALLPGAAPPPKNRFTRPDKIHDISDETPQMLQHVTKDRAKIPIKRRPSTRQARLAAIRKSQFFEENNEPQLAKINDTLGAPETEPLFDDLGDGEDIFKPLKTSKDETGVPQTPQSSLFDTQIIEQKLGDPETSKNEPFLDVLEDNEDIFKPLKTPKDVLFKDEIGAPQIPQPSIFDTQIIEQKLETRNEPFSDVLEDNEDIFKPLKAPEDDLFKKETGVPETQGLFGGSDSASELFSGKKSDILANKEPSSLFSDPSDSDEDLFSKKIVTKTSKKKPDLLFGSDSDGSEEDDLFKPATATGKKVEVKSATVKKLQAKEADDDPLSEFY